MAMRVTVRVKESEMAKIERYIKKEYPHVKTVSSVVRHALDDFLGQSCT